MFPFLNIKIDNRNIITKKWGEKNREIIKNVTGKSSGDSVP